MDASAETDAEFVPILLMKSRMPRKVNASELTGISTAHDSSVAAPVFLGETSFFGASTADKDVYAMDFMEHGQNRIREASRKNVVVEEVACVRTKMTNSSDEAGLSEGMVQTEIYSQGIAAMHRNGGAIMQVLMDVYATVFSVFHAFLVFVCYSDSS